MVNKPNKNLTKLLKNAKTPDATLTEAKVLTL